MQNYSQHFSLIVKQIDDPSEITIVISFRENKFVCPKYKYFISEIKHYIA